MEEGILPGGGVALLRAKAAVAKLKAENPDMQAGINITPPVRVEAPIRQIAENSGVEGLIVAARSIPDNKSRRVRLRCADERHVDMPGGGHCRSGESRSCGSAGRSICCRPSDYD